MPFKREPISPKPKNAKKKKKITFFMLHSLRDISHFFLVHHSKSNSPKHYLFLLVCHSNLDDPLEPLDLTRVSNCYPNPQLANS